MVYNIGIIGIILAFVPCKPFMHDMDRAKTKLDAEGAKSARDPEPNSV